MRTSSSRILRVCAKRINLLRWAQRSAVLFTLSLQIVAVVKSQESVPSTKCPPVTRLDSAKDSYGSTVVADPYRWLGDQDRAGTRAWIAEQKMCPDRALSKLRGRTEITRRVSDLLHRDFFEPPLERGGRYFFRKQLVGQDLFLLYVRRGSNAPDEVLIDPHPWSADHSASVTLENISRDGKFVFYGRREGGQDEITPRVLEVETKRTLPDAFLKAQYFSIEPTPGNAGVYYARVTPEGPRAFYHQMGQDSEKDQLIFGNTLGKDKILALQLSEDGKYLVYQVVYGSGSEQTDIYVQNVKEHGPIVAAVENEKALFYPTFSGEQFFILTNWKAPQWRVFATSFAAPQREHWREIVPESDVHLDSIAAAGGKLIGQYTHNVSSELKMFDGNGKVQSSVALPALGSVTAATSRGESPELFFTFDSYNYPPAIFRYDVNQTKPEVWARDKLRFDSSAFEIEQVWYLSKDKTRVPMVLFHKKGLKMDGSNPVLMTGYGGFGASETPAYQSIAVLWAERGGIYADVSLRGGGEFGEDWHRAGMFGKKQTVFDDFIAAAEFLIANKYTTSARLAIVGASNGGLLVGAAMTQRPELFRAVVCEYPLLDMLRFQKFEDGAYWVSEYGTADNVDQFRYLYQYSPYHRVVNGAKYPSALFITGDGDTRVAPLHARKMAARLQAATGSAGALPVVLHNQ